MKNTEIKCVAIDDEPLALEIVTDYISKISFLKNIGSFRNAIEAFDFVQKFETDLLFLDINMPDITGMQFLSALINQPMVIFTTAYSKYAVESYDYKAVDYILKPIVFPRFLKAANKARDIFILRNNVEIAKEETISFSKQEEKNYTFVKSGTENHLLHFSDIIYVEATGNYVTFYTEKKKIMSLMNLKTVLDILPPYNFIRVHKSFIIALDRIQFIEKHRIMIDKIQIPIGNTYREAIFERTRN